MNGNDAENGGNVAGGQAADPVVRSFDGKIILLGIYLLAALALCGFFLGRLMTADTKDLSDKNGSLAECKVSPTPTATPTPTPISNNNVAGNSNGSISNSGNQTATNTNVNSAGSTVGTPSPSATPTENATPTSPTPTPTPAKEYTVPRVLKLEPPPFFTGSGCMTGDGFVFLIVLFAGMVGAAIRCMYSFLVHVGRRDFGFNWLWYYLLLPYFGGALGLVLYFVIRGGFYNNSVGQPLYINIFSFAALGALTGLFSDQAFAKLKLVAESLFTKTEEKTNQPAIASLRITPSITLSDDSRTHTLTCTAMDSRQMPIKGVSTDRMTWKSENTKVATVDNGVVTKVAAGECSVFATANDNAVVSNACKVKCE